jgi:hypothetical protein
MSDMGIINVVQMTGEVRIELEDGFYISLNRGGMIVGKERAPQDEHAHVSALGADQIARTIMSWEFVNENSR